MLTLRSWLSIGTLDETLQPQELAYHGINAVLLLDNLNGWVRPQVNYLDLSQPDNTPIPVESIAEALDFIHEQRNMGAHILIADSHGLGRATAIAAAAIKTKSGCSMSLIEAYKSLWDGYPHDLPHSYMWEAVRDYYEHEASFDVLWFHLNALTQHATYQEQN